MIPVYALQFTRERRRGGYLIPALIAIMIAIVFFADIMAPRGISVGVLYIVPLYLTVYVRWRYAPFTVAGVAIILTITGYFLSPPGVPVEYSLFNRTARSLIFIILAFLIWIYSKSASLLEESEKKYRSLFETMSEGFGLAEIIIDDQGKPIDYRLLEVNPAFEKLTGLRREIAEGRSARELIPDLEPSWVEAFGHVALTGEPMHFENYNNALDKWFNVNTYSPSRRRFVLIFTDITARKRAEDALRSANQLVEKNFAQLQAVLESMAEGLVIADPHANRVHHNPASLALHGYADLDEAQKPLDDPTPAWQVLDLEGHPVPRSDWPLHRALRGERFTDYEVRLRRSDTGGEFIGSYNGTPVYDRGGRLILAITTIRDITRQKQTEEEIQKYTQQLRRSNEDLEMFAYAASHDLQEPLRTIVSFTQLLQQRCKENEDTSANEFILFIVDAGKRMQNLISDLLEYSRVTTRREAIQATDSETVLGEVLENLHLSIEENRVTISHDPLPIALADASQLRQVFQNLISNAIKFRKPDVPPEIHVSAKRMDGMVRFSVSDNGIGIEPQYFDRIFVIFQRLHSRDQYEGTGIGLASVKRIIDRHGGTIWVESESGKGSTFYFTLPAANGTT
jgi:PAS domain S-box-containing protein